MSEGLRELDPVFLARIYSHAETLRLSLAEQEFVLGEAPHSVEILEATWVRVVDYPIPDEALDWVVTAMAALLGEQLRSLYGFRWMELVDEHGSSPCMVERRTGIKAFPFDAILRRIQANEGTFFAAFLGQTETAMKSLGHPFQPEGADPGARAGVTATSSQAGTRPWWRIWQRRTELSG